MTKNVVLYARLSISTERSTSIERQLEAGQQYAAAQGWKVVGQFVDDGVSASKNRPEARTGWRALMASQEQFDAVVIWRLDRLARRLRDFWQTYHSLEERGCTLASVTDNLDMSTTIGQILAGILAGFAQMEAEVISARAADSRQKLLNVGRYPGGAKSYGWRSVPNEDGAGWVLEHDPNQIEWVKAMIERTLDGRSTHSTALWLNAQGVPGQKGGTWAHNTVRQIMENPILAGMVSYNPGNKKTLRGPDVLRGPDGLPVVNDALAVMALPQWRVLQERLKTDSRTGEPTKPRAMLKTSSGVLSGLVWCRECNLRMHRAVSARGELAYRCKAKGGCGQSISAFEHLVIDHFLATVGDTVRWSVVEEIYDGASALLPEINQRLSELAVEFVNATGDRITEITQQMADLKVMQANAQAQPSEVRLDIRDANLFKVDWDAAEDDESRRDVLGDACQRIWVAKGPRGHWTDESKLARLEFDWRVRPSVA